MVGAIYTAIAAWIIFGNDINNQRILVAGNWRIFSAVCALPVLVTSIASYKLIPESPQYLLRHCEFQTPPYSIENVFYYYLNYYYYYIYTL